MQKLFPQEGLPAYYRDLTGNALTTAVSREIKGVLQVQYIPPDSAVFGNEVIVGLRHTREFGTILSAGFEAVGMADSIQSDDFTMEFAGFGDKTVSDVRSVLAAKALDRLVTISNPIDIHPAADDQVHGDIAAILCRDPGVDAVIISVYPMSPVMRTLDIDPENQFSMHHKGAILHWLTHLNNTSETPIVGAVDGGRRYDAFA